MDIKRPHSLTTASISCSAAKCSSMCGTISDRCTVVIGSEGETVRHHSSSDGIALNRRDAAVDECRRPASEVLSHLDHLGLYGCDNPVRWREAGFRLRRYGLRNLSDTRCAQCFAASASRSVAERSDCRHWPMARCEHRGPSLVQSVDDCRSRGVAPLDRAVAVVARLELS